MTAAVALLGVGLSAVLLTVNAAHPARRGVHWRALSFLACYLLVELPLAAGALAVGLAGPLLVAGAGGYWAGRAGLALLVASATVTAGRTTLARRDLRRPGTRRVRTGRVVVTRDIGFAEVDGVRLRLDLYRPARPRPDGAPLPGLLQLHGGALTGGHRRRQARPLLRRLAAQGWCCLAIDYRLSPAVAVPAHLQDCKRAIAWYRSHAAEFGADPDFLCVTGGSAGGYLAALVALTDQDPRYQPGFPHVCTSVRAAVPLYGIYDVTNCHTEWGPAQAGVMERSIMQARLAEAPERFRDASPVYRVHAAAPPFLVVHGALDTMAPVAQARRFVARLRAVSDAEVGYLELAGAQHAFDLLPSYRCARVVAQVHDFLRRQHERYLSVRAATDGRASPVATASPD